MTWKLDALPPMPCLRSLALHGRAIEGVAALRDRTPGLSAIEAHGALSEVDAAALGTLSSLRELRVWPGDAARFASVTQITRLHTRANTDVLRAFEGAALTRLVLKGNTTHAVLGRVATQFPLVSSLDVEIHPRLQNRRVPEFASLARLETLILNWHAVPPRLPSLPALRMFVARGELDHESLQWLRRQRDLRTVHSSVADEFLRSALPGVRSYTIGRPPIDSILPPTTTPDNLGL